MNTAQHLQQLLQIPVTRVTVGEHTRVYSTSDVYAGCIPTQMQADEPQFDTADGVLNRFHWETIYITNRAELNTLVMQLYPDAYAISLAPYRHLFVKDRHGKQVGLVECIYEDKWTVRKAE